MLLIITLSVLALGMPVALPFYVSAVKFAVWR
jgi:hypothetical protein